MEAEGVKQIANQVKYSKDFEIPEEFPKILRDLTREILRVNPGPTAAEVEKFGTCNKIILLVN